MSSFAATRRALGRVLSARHSPFPGVETLSQALDRVVRTVARNPQEKDEFSTLMKRGAFLPAGRTLLSADPVVKAVIPNCAVVPPTIKAFESFMRHTTGLGTCLNSIHPGSVVSRLEQLCNVPVADATGRKPGVMATLHWAHPDAAALVDAKAANPDGALSNANISLIVPANEWETFRGSPIFDLSVRAAWACGDPGLLLSPNHQTAAATSPCGELWLTPWEVCTLGNLHLPALTNTMGELDMAQVRSATRSATKFLDAVVDSLRFPCLDAQKATAFHRRVGLGVMGWADVLQGMGIPYDSNDALALAESTSWNMRSAAQQESTETGRRHGKEGMQNSTVLALAPTGGTSSLFRASYSIEPHFKDAHSISSDAHLRMLAAWQRHVDNGVSKTVNLPSHATEGDVAGVFDTAHALGVKGVTVYRDGCRHAQPLAVGTKANCEECVAI